MQHPDRLTENQSTDCRFRMKHDICGMGVLLLELHKGRHFGIGLRAWRERNE